MDKPEIPHYKESLAIMQLLIYLPTLIIVFPKMPFWIAVVSCTLAFLIPFYWIWESYKQGTKSYTKHLVLKQLGALAFAAAELYFIYDLIHLH